MIKNCFTQAHFTYKNKMKVMGKVMLEFKGKNVEGSVVSALVKKNLTPS
jgi:hypothetical protein